MVGTVAGILVAAATAAATEGAKETAKDLYRGLKERIVARAAEQPDDGPDDTALKAALALLEADPSASDAQAHVRRLLDELAVDDDEEAVRLAGALRTELAATGSVTTTITTHHTSGHTITVSGKGNRVATDEARIEEHGR